jgi:hypothetical protein
MSLTQQYSSSSSLNKIDWIKLSNNPKVIEKMIDNRII